MGIDFRIALVGQAAFGRSVLDALVEAGETIAGIFCPPDRAGAAADPIKASALAHGIGVHQFKRLRDSAAVAAFRATRPDLCVMAFVTDIVPNEMITAPPHGTIQYHPSLLPKHRGPSSINWPIIQGETRTGLSIFWPDEGLDTGPILMQREVDILPDDTLGTVYFDKLFPLGVEALVESVRLVRAGKAPRIAQDHSQMTYESWCKSENALVDWSKTVAEVYNLVRGCDPSPGALSSFAGSNVKLYAASLQASRAELPPGQVIAIDSGGVKVACNGGAVQIGRVQPDGGKKQAASEWAAAVNLKRGDVLGG